MSESEKLSENVPPRLRIFVSSPGDVNEERVLANRVIKRLADDLRDRVTVEPVFWEHEPLLATASFQDQIIRPSETDIVVCILWSRVGTRLPSHLRRPDGTTYTSGTEYEFEDAVEARRQTGRPDLIVYRKTAEPVVSLADEDALVKRLTQKKALDQFVSKWFHNPDEGTLIAAFHTFLSSAEFEERLETHLRKMVLQRLPVDDGTRTSVSLKPSWTSGSPFRGLQAFDFEHAPIFFGRTKAIGDVLNALRQQAAASRAFVLVLGASGSGKSSLVRAGVLPLLTQPGVVEGVGLWRRAILRPSDAGGNIFQSLTAALIRPEALPELTADGTAADAISRDLRENPKAIALLIKGGLSQAAAELARSQNLAKQPDARLVVFVDQLEELFTSDRTTAEDRRAFVDALSALARSGRVWVIGTLRSDFYPRCAEISELVALKEGAGSYDLMLPSPSEIGQMVRQPAHAAGLRFEEDPASGEHLDDLLRDAAVASPESLPLLEFALEELYRQRTNRGLLTHAAYRALGGVEGALAKKAEEVFTSLTTDVQAAMPRVLRALVTTSEDGSVARKQATLDRSADSPAAKAFIEWFVAARLLTADRTPDGTAIVAVAHEALLRHWPRLVRWLAEDKEFLGTRSRLTTAAARWRQESRSGDFLLPEGKPLAEGKHLLQHRMTDLDDEVKEYVRASDRRVTSRNRRRRVVVTSVLASVLTVLTAFTIFSYAQWQRAEREAQHRRASPGFGRVGPSHCRA